jgi:ethanolamine phosphate transferase 2 subunit G
MRQFLLCLLGTACFLYGFLQFDIPATQNSSSYESSVTEGNRSPLFDRLVFMVVDALRQDFAFGSNSSMRFLRQLIDKGHAKPYIGLAKEPTVTMPRIKALTSGIDPTFIDILTNFWATSNEHTDTWLHRLKNERNFKLVFYGDETWLKLYPTSFDRSEGTTSFFVSVRNGLIWSIYSVGYDRGGY